MLKEVTQKPVIPAVHMKTPSLFRKRAKSRTPHLMDLKHIHQSVKNMQ